MFKLFWDKSSHFSCTSFPQRIAIHNCHYIFFIFVPPLFFKATFNLTIFNYPWIMTFLVQNKSVVIWLKMCQLHSGATRLFVGCSKLNTESLATRLLKYSSPQKLKFLMKLVRATVSKATLEEKPNCTKILLSNYLFVRAIGIISASWGCQL